MTVTISQLYDDYATASRAVRDLEAAGVPHSEISVSRAMPTIGIPVTGTGRPAKGAVAAAGGATGGRAV